jgi:hypothetical protein
MPAMQPSEGDLWLGDSPSVEMPVQDERLRDKDPPIQMTTART